MAELTPAPASACCSSEQQASCCEPSEKADCCTPESSSCGCSAGQGDVREQVRERYAAAARTADAATGSVVLTDEYGREVFGGTLYDEQDTGEAQGALASSLGCGVPTAVADLQEGETVLDLASPVCSTLRGICGGRDQRKPANTGETADADAPHFRGFSPVFAGLRKTPTNRGERLDLAWIRGIRGLCNGFAG
jgi:hypothetical protein